MTRNLAYAKPRPVLCSPQFSVFSPLSAIPIFKNNLLVSTYLCLSIPLCKIKAFTLNQLGLIEASIL